MSSERRCSFCKMLLEGEVCELATYKRTIDGKEYVFCCESCASKFE